MDPGGVDIGYLPLDEDNQRAILGEEGFKKYQTILEKLGAEPRTVVTVYGDNPRRYGIHSNALPPDFNPIHLDENLSPIGEEQRAEEDMEDMEEDIQGAAGSGVPHELKIRLPGYGVKPEVTDKMLDMVQWVETRGLEPGKATEASPAVTDTGEARREKKIKMLSEFYAKKNPAMPAEKIKNIVNKRLSARANTTEEKQQWNTLSARLEKKYEEPLPPLPPDEGAYFSKMEEDWEKVHKEKFPETQFQYAEEEPFKFGVEEDMDVEEEQQAVVDAGLNVAEGVEYLGDGLNRLPPEEITTIIKKEMTKQLPKIQQLFPSSDPKKWFALSLLLFYGLQYFKLILESVTKHYNRYVDYFRETREDTLEKLKKQYTLGVKSMDDYLITRMEELFRIADSEASVPGLTRFKVVVNKIFEGDSVVQTTPAESEIAPRFPIVKGMIDLSENLLDGSEGDPPPEQLVAILKYGTYAPGRPGRDYGTRVPYILEGNNNVYRIRPMRSSLVLDGVISLIDNSKGEVADIAGRTVIGKIFDLLDSKISQEIIDLYLLGFAMTEFAQKQTFRSWLTLSRKQETGEEVSSWSIDESGLFSDIMDCDYTVWENITKLLKKKKGLSTAQLNSRLRKQGGKVKLEGQNLKDYRYRLKTKLNIGGIDAYDILAYHWDSWGLAETPEAIDRIRDSLKSELMSLADRDSEELDRIINTCFHKSDIRMATTNVRTGNEKIVVAALPKNPPDPAWSGRTGIRGRSRPFDYHGKPTEKEAEKPLTVEEIKFFIKGLIDEKGKIGAETSRLIKEIYDKPKIPNRKALRVTAKLNALRSPELIELLTSLPPTRETLPWIKYGQSISTSKRGSGYSKKRSSKKKKTKRSKRKKSKRKKNKKKTKRKARKIEVGDIIIKYN